jgi:3-methyladenine DNA glycosylase AlkD
MIIEKLRQEIARHDRPENQINYQQFFKEKLKHPLGLKTPILRKISNRLFRDIKNWPKKQILDLGDKLLASQERYFRFFAFEWAIKIKDQYTPADFARFERWLKKYVDNWGACDHLCCGPIGNIIRQYPKTAGKTKRWIPSKNRWLRRAAAVSLIIPVRHRMLLDEVFDTADKLLTDDDDMVQKGYGWMLKVAGDQYPDEVFDFVMKNKAEMPRTALRYAIEKYPPAKRRQAMKK